MSKKHKQEGGQATMFTSGTGRCYETHPRLSVLGGTLIGGNCGNPVEKNADIYVGFDGCWKPHGDMPWEAKPAINVYYPIQDGSVPQNLERFKGLVKWAIENLSAGKTVHMGCIGGHGRTGLVFAALIKEGLGIEDSVAWVREHYCKKAVETDQQCRWLTEHFGIAKATGSKAHQYDGYAPPVGGFQGSAGAYWQQGKANDLLAERQKYKGTGSGAPAARPAYDDGPASVPAGGMLAIIKHAPDSDLSIWRAAVRRESVEIS